MGMSVGMLGALAAGGKAVSSMAAEKSKELDDDRLRQIELQTQMDREARIREQTLQVQDRAEQRYADRQQSEYKMGKQKRQDELEFQTNPENIQKAVGAEVLKKQAVDRYSDSRFPMELEQKKQLVEATDNTDYAARDLENQKRELELKRMQEEKIPTEYKDALHALSESERNLTIQYKQAATDVASLEADPAVTPAQLIAARQDKMGVLEELKGVRGQKQTILSKFLPEQQARATQGQPQQNADPLGIRKILGEQTPKQTGMLQDKSAGLRKQMADELRSYGVEPDPSWSTRQLTEELAKFRDSKTGAW